MLITICYSVLTWLQSRQRQEILSWIDEICLENKVSLVFMKKRLYSLPSAASTLTTVTSISIGSPTTASFLTTPRSQVASHSPSLTSLKRPSIGISDFSSTKTGSATGTQVSDLCYNYENIKRTRLLWEEDGSRVLALFPLQIVELHHWCAFVGTELEVQNTNTNTSTSVNLNSNTAETVEDLKSKPQLHLTFHILLEAEPGFTKDKDSYRKFSQFGRITAWKCGYELALILRSELEQLIELMHIFRLGQIVLDGGWRVYRLTTVGIQGTIGTLISRTEIQSSQTSFTPAELRKLQAGIYDCGESFTTISTDTSKQELSKLCSDIECNSITKLELEEEEDSLKISELPNWHDRSPKKRSIATIHYSERPKSAHRKLSLCSNSLSNLSNKSSSLASLLFGSRSMSIDEKTSSGTSSALNSPAQTPDKESAVFKVRTRKASGPSRQQSSFDSIFSTPDRTKSSLAIPINCTVGGLDPTKSMSTSTLVAAPTSPLRSSASGLTIKSPSRLGKPPNILILAEDAKKRSELAKMLKPMLANDRYAIYEIRWDQIAVGGWSDQTALLVLSGKIPDETAASILLQFLGDGGRLLAWCCETPPFGLPITQKSLTSNMVKALNYATTQTQPIHLSGANWGPQTKSDSTSLPSTFQRVIETNDSEGFSRPLTSSTFAKTKDKGDVVIIQLDGGVMGGKAVLSQVQFEKSMNEDSTLGLLSLILSQNLGLDCTRIKIPEYTEAYLLGDHKIINDFLSKNPSTIEQRDLALEFIPRGSTTFSKPTHERLPILSLKCPTNFSTLNYFDNLNTKDLGRLVVYGDVLTSTQDIITGHPLRHGLVAIARRQTSGRGRGKNIWLSPEGCAMFSLQLHLDLNSDMGRRISLVQHIAALAIILAVPSHKEIDLRVKWPNDIYLHGKKVGGILVESQLQGKMAVINVGIGVNVANAYPTVCLNSVLGEPLTPAVLIAKVLTELEKLQDMVENGQLETVLELYIDNWIHNKEDEINVEVSEGRFTACNLVGLDEFGFLRVMEISSSHIFSVQPDGNSFDITNKLIALKD